MAGYKLSCCLLPWCQLPVGTGSPTSNPVLQRTVLGWSHSCAQRRQLSRFWEVDSCPTSRGLSKEEAACEQYFTETTTHDESGRFIVRLPKKEGILSHLGDSKAGALRRLRWMQRRLIKNPDLNAQYVGFMAEYLDLGHMISVDPLQDTTHSHPFYLPHHAVLKPSSTTTKCRVVFDGSSKSSTGISLNDCLMVGPTVQDTLYSIVVRFRNLVADIAKMYRQIWIHPDDRHLQRLFWKGETDFVGCPYELTTVTYGLSSAPYLVTRCLQQLSYEHSKDDGDIPLKIGKDFYVDDFLSGSDTEVLSHIPDEFQDKRSIVKVDDIQGSVSTLGLLWHPESDTFRFKVHEFSMNLPITKWIVVSEMSKLFDPLGILGPVHAYGACVYIRSIGMDGAIACRLLTAKSRVAPIQTLSFPRLELSSAVLLSQLYKNVVCSLNMTPEAYFWSDSSITHTFVSNSGLYTSVTWHGGMSTLACAAIESGPSQKIS
ncbi:uncharacterized protein LOC134207383 [Armigeres subalbatus]|uniref:uncharacterized protein LOC134207383 n=1 Tax=Armigeres subalbatus TaxID=124917 RepID=UPI002ECFB277